jgi:hypothetical protein
MRKLLWMIVLFGIYVWIMTSGHEQMFFDRAKNFYAALVSWFDDAEVDFQVQEKKPTKRPRSRRWD